MKKLNQNATRVLLHLIQGLEEGQARKLDEGGRAIMAVHVDVLRVFGRKKLVVVAHRFEQNGDLVPDPDMEILVDDQGNGVVEAFPTAIDQALGYRRAVDLEADLSIEKYRPNWQADMVQFANMWMMNIRAQQRLDEAIT